MYAPQHDAGEMAAFCLLPEDLDDEERVITIWPENATAFRLFLRLTTQWNMGFNGPVGLNYGHLYPLIDRLNLAPDDWEEMFESVRVIESSALSQMAENREQAEADRKK